MKFRVFIALPLFVFLAAFPFQCNTTKDAGVFKTVDSAETWQQKVTIDDKNNISKASVLTIALDPQNSETIYLGTNGDGLYKSTNGGQNWVKIEDSRGFLSEKAVVYDIAIDPTDSNKIYLATYQSDRGRVFRSQDGASSFEEVYVTDKKSFAINDIIVDNTNPEVIYMGTGQGGFLKSRDFGKSWSLIRWFDSSVTNIALNPQNTNIIYLSTERQGVYMTTDRGQNWESFKDNLKEFGSASKVKTIIIDQRNPQVIYLGSDFGLLRSQDSGNTWQAIDIVIPPKSMPILSVAIDPNGSDHIYYGAGSIFYKSIDRGQSWTIHQLPSAKFVKAIALDHNDSNIIYIGMMQQ